MFHVHRDQRNFYERRAIPWLPLACFYWSELLENLAAKGIQDNHNTTPHMVERTTDDGRSRVKGHSVSKSMYTPWGGTLVALELN